MLASNQTANCLPAASGIPMSEAGSHVVATLMCMLDVDDKIDNLHVSIPSTRLYVD